ncbi:xaa-Pro aminopeptidase ApepP isoform X2 [Topomyia yanbarensis]|uniref:xaa-Pro aminopeptidase ApepP isoform X2 n=1 Tax=Topomyia yanbarensis TaxID=2498891 RepID=UPI00273C7481|nr:xaa-Pro aminopeptidase ApepP isoform X2 [Topomyia yanbarensis]
MLKIALQATMMWKLATVFLLASTVLAVFPMVVANQLRSAQRIKCLNPNREKDNITLHHRLTALRNEMRTRSSTQTTEIDAYIVTTYDEHMSDQLMESDRRLKFLTGFSGPGLAVVTIRSAALWIDRSLHLQTEHEVNCNWKIFHNDEHATVREWIANELSPESRVGADPQLVPHSLWHSLERQLNLHSIKLIKVHRNLVDLVWGSQRPASKSNSIKVHPVRFAGERWDSKVNKLRSNLTSLRCEAMIVTSLTEVAYILNLRGCDIPYTPVFKSYLLVSNREIVLYTNRTHITTGLINHLKSHNCHNEYCVQVKDYEDVWRDLRTLSQHWKRILVPSTVVFDLGASEAIYSVIPRELVLNKPSPIIFLRAQKNEVERQGMRRAHIRDAAAFCEALSYLEKRFIAGDDFTEQSFAREIDRSRKIQDLSEGTSFKSVVAFGPNSGDPHYTTSNLTDHGIGDDNTIIIDSGGQYQDGTTDVTRTIHLGEPKARHVEAYTNVLIGLIHMSMTTFPENLKPAELDALARGPVQGSRVAFPYGSGHGIGSYLSVRESPISSAHTVKQRHTFREGYFFAYDPGYYIPSEFGIRLENVLEVQDTGTVHPSGYKFFSFQDATLIPFEPKLIDSEMLSTTEVKWINDYNARIRQLVGDELKRKQKMEAFYWMMNKTRNIPDPTHSGAYATVMTCRAAMLLLVALAARLAMIF